MAWSRCLIRQRLSSSWWQREGRVASLSLSLSLTTRGTLALGMLAWSTENLEGWDFWAQEAQETQEAHQTLSDSVYRTRKLLTAESGTLEDRFPKVPCGIACPYPCIVEPYLATTKRLLLS